MKNDFFKLLLMNFTVCFVIMMFATSHTLKQEEVSFEQEIEIEINESQSVEIIEIEKPTQQDEPESVPAISIEPQYPEFVYSKDWNANEGYLLAKIAMAEAEGCSIETKCYVIMTVLNRVHSKEFPNSIEKVIFQQRKGVYQFTPIGDGRWNRVEPNEDCWLALNIVMESPYDFSEGALYFESCKSNDSWHSRNLELLYESDEMRFYR